MANELTISFQNISFLKNSIAVNITNSVNPLTVTINGVHHVYDQVSLTTGDTVISKGAVGTIGFIWVKNVDATNNIQLSDDGTVYALMLKPGEYAYFRWNAAAFHAKATAGTPILQYAIFED